MYGTRHIQNGGGFAGAVWSISSAGAFILIHSLASADGSGPNSPLVIGADGALYGTTGSGGAFGAGPCSG